jgi:hypothetical protein
MSGILLVSASYAAETERGKIQAVGGNALATIGPIGDSATFWPS